MKTQKIMLEVFAAILVALLALTGCSGDGNRTVAKVNGYEIKEDELDQFFKRIRPTYATAQEEYNKKRELLDTMIITRLMVQAAYEKNIDKLGEVDSMIASYSDRFLLDALYQKHIASKAEPTEAELKEYYDRLELKIRASHILVDNLDTADVILARIQNGENFDQLAFDYSIDPSAKRNKGDLGYFAWGAMVDEFQRAAFAMEPGEVSPPVKTQYGYHIIKLVDKLPNEQRGEFSAMREEIHDRLLRDRSAEIAKSYFEQIAAKYPFTLDTSTCDYVLHKQEIMYPPQVLAQLPRNDFDQEQLDRNEKELVIATWEGGPINLIEYLTMAKKVPPAMRPDFDNYDSLKTFIFSLKRMDILAHEGKQEGVDRDEAYLNKVRLFKELFMADIMKNDSIAVIPTPDEDVVRQYYDEHLDEFTNPATVHIYEILLSDELKAQKLAKSIRSLKEFKEKAAELTERPGRRSRSGDLEYIQRKWYPELFDLAMKTRVGKIAGPIISLGKYSIIWVEDKTEPQLKDFIGLKKSIAEKLKKEQKDLAIQTWVDDRLKNSRVEIDEEALWATINQDKYVSTETN